MRRSIAILLAMMLATVSLWSQQLYPPHPITYELYFDELQTDRPLPPAGPFSAANTLPGTIIGITSMIIGAVFLTVGILALTGALDLQNSVGPAEPQTSIIGADQPADVNSDQTVAGIAFVAMGALFGIVGALLAFAEPPFDP